MKSEALFVLLHNIRSVHNVGSVIRTAECFGFDGVLISGYSPTPKHPKLAKTALGAESLIHWEYMKSPKLLIKKLKKLHPDLVVVGLENNLKTKTKPITKFNSKRPIVLVLGEEVGGIPKSLFSLCDEIVEIPQMGQKESLNVSVAFGIAAFSFRNCG